MGVLLGGHAFNVDKPDLLPSFWLCVLTGIALGVSETGCHLLWFHQGRGLMTIGKLGLLCAVPLCWELWHLRMAILLTVVVLASVGSHMPARFRYYSVLHREVTRCHDGPGTAALLDETPDDPCAQQQTLDDGNG